jgi:hypothetical protein
MTEPTHADPATVNQRITELAKELFPESGYETPEENDASSLFILLCQAVRLYSDTAYDPIQGVPELINKANVQTTLDAIGENLIEVSA